MQPGLLTQTILAAFVTSAVVLVFLVRFASHRAQWPFVAAAVMLLDQGAKCIVVRALPDGQPIAYLGGVLQVGYYTNHLQGFGAASPGILWLALVGAVAGLRLYQMLAERRYRMSLATQAGLGLLLGGIMSIAIERLCTGFVIDFLSFAGHAYAYNLADVAALGGVAVLLARALVALPGLILREAARAGAE